MRLEIGQKIKQLRLHRGITQEQLGQSLGLTGQAISKWESNTTMPDIQLLPELSALLGVSIDTLFSITDRTHICSIRKRQKLTKPIWKPRPAGCPIGTWETTGNSLLFTRISSIRTQMPGPTTCG